ncbi:hypothetical protein ACSQ5K_04600 [Pseudomonas sp. PhalM4]
MWEIVDSTTRTGVGTWQGYVVAAVPGILALVTVLVGQKTTAKSERDSTRAALLAEVSSLKEIVETRGYVPELRACARFFETPEGIDWQKSGRVHKPNIVVAEHFNMIYKANLTRLGGLSTTEANQIVRFHQLAHSFAIDCGEGGTLYEGSNDPDVFNEAADILEAALTIAEQLVEPAPLGWFRGGWERLMRGRNVDVGKE